MLCCFELFEMSILYQASGEHMITAQATKYWYHVETMPYII